MCVCACLWYSNWLSNRVRYWAPTPKTCGNEMLSSNFRSVNPIAFRQGYVAVTFQELVLLGKTYLDHASWKFIRDCQRYAVWVCVVWAFFFFMDGLLSSPYYSDVFQWGRSFDGWVACIWTEHDGIRFDMFWTGIYYYPLLRSMSLLQHMSYGTIARKNQVELRGAAHSLSNMQALPKCLAQKPEKNCPIHWFGRKLVLRDACSATSTGWCI